MGFGEFWLQSKNGKKIDLNFQGQVRRSDFLGNEKLLSIFNFFDKDGNGAIESDGIKGNELTNLFGFIKKTAELRKGGDNSVIDVQEAYSLAQNAEELKHVSSSDILEFLSILEDKKNVIVKSDTYTYSDGTVYSVNHFSDGGEETVIYDKDGNVRIKMTEHPLSEDYSGIEPSTDENGNTVYDKRDERGRGAILTVVKDSNYVAVSDSAQKYMQEKYGVAAQKAVFQDGHLIYLDENNKPIAHIRYEISPKVKEQIRTFVGENLENIEYLLEILKDVGWIDRIGINLQDISFSLKNGLELNGQEVLKQYLLEAIEDAKNGKYLKTMATGDDGSYGVQHFDSKYKEITGKDSLDFVQAEKLRITTLKYNEVKSLYQRIEVLNKGLAEVKRLHKNAQTAKNGIPGSEKLNTDYDGKLVEVLKGFFYDNEDITRAFIASISQDIASKDDIYENLPEILNRIENSVQKSLDTVLGGETFEQLEARYQKEYKAVYGKEDVIPKIEEMVTDGKEIGSFVQMGLMTAASVILGAFTGGTGSVALDSFIGFLETVGTDYALSLSNALTSKQGLTRESHQAILERTTGTAEFIGFGMVVANPLARTAGKLISKAISPSSSKLVGGAFARGAVKGAVVKTVGSVTKTTLSCEQMLQFMMVKSGEFFTEVGAFTGFELMTNDEDFIKAFGGQASMLSKIKVMNSAIQVLLGSFLKNRIIAKNSKQVVKQYNQMLQDAGLKDSKISEHKSPSGTKYTLEMEGKSYTFNNIEELSTNLTMLMAVSYASAKEVSAEVKAKTTDELKAEYKRLMELEKFSPEEADLVVDVFNELNSRGEINENGDLINDIIPENMPQKHEAPVTGVMSDIGRYIEGYNQYGEDYIPEGLDNNSVFMEFFRYKQDLCAARPEEKRGNFTIKARPAKDKIFDRTKGESPESCLNMLNELKEFIFSKSQYATKEDYYQVIEEIAKQMPEYVKTHYPDIRPEIAENADKIFRWQAYGVGQLPGERRADGSYEITANRFFDAEKQQQAVKEYTEFLEKMTGKKVLVGGTEVFGTFANMVGIFNNPETYADVDYIILGHGTGNSKITDSSSADTWMFKYSGKSVWEYIEENVPEGKKALVLVCEHDELSPAERKNQPDMVDNNGVVMRAVGVPADGTINTPLKICTSGVRHIMGQISAPNNNAGLFAKGLVINDPKIVMYDFDYSKYKSKTEEAVDAVKDNPSAANIDDSQISIVNDILSFKSESDKLIDCCYINILADITPERLNVMRGLIELSKTCDNEILKNINNIRYIADDIADLADVETVKQIFSQKDAKGNYVINLSTYDRFAAEKFETFLMRDKVQAPVSEDLRKTAEMVSENKTNTGLDKYKINSGERTDNHMKYMQQHAKMFESSIDDDDWTYFKTDNQKKCAWKMHLFSVDEIDWQKMCEVVIPYFNDHGIDFKTLSCTCSPEKLAEGWSHQAGKAFTIFPHSNEEMAQIAKDLDYIIKNNNLQTSGSKIAGDRQMGDSGRIFYRYEYKSGQHKDEILDLDKPEDCDKYEAYYDKNRGADRYLASDMTEADDIWRDFLSAENTNVQRASAETRNMSSALSPEQKIEINLKDLKEHSSRAPEEIQGFEYYMRKYPEKADVITVLAKSNYNIKVGTDLNGNMASHLDAIMFYIDKYPQYEKQIIDYMSVQRKAFNDTSNPVQYLNAYIQMLEKNPDKADVIAELTNNHNLQAGDINLLLTYPPERYSDLIALARKQYTENAINNQMRLIDKYPSLRQVITREDVQFDFIDEEPQNRTPEEIKNRMAVAERVQAMFPKEIAEMKQTLGDKFFENIKWEDVIPDNMSESDIKILLDIINSSSKFFARTKINEVKHGKNLKWAMEMDKISGCAVELMRDGKDLDAVIDQIAFQYHAYDERVTFDSNTEVSDRRQYSGRYRGYDPQRIEGAAYGALTPYDKNMSYNEYYERFKAISGQHRTYNNGEIQLTEIGVEGGYGDCMLHPGNDNVEPAMEYLRKNYHHNIKPLIEKVKNGGTLSEQEIKEVHYIIAGDYYLMANVMPWGRGSNGICDIYMRSLYQALGIEMPAIKQGVSLDLEAFCLTPEEYYQKWLTFFEE